MFLTHYPNFLLHTSSGLLVNLGNWKACNACEIMEYENKPGKATFGLGREFPSMELDSHTLTPEDTPVRVHFAMTGRVISIEEKIKDSIVSIGCPETLDRVIWLSYEVNLMTLYDHKWVMHRNCQEDALRVNDVVRPEHMEFRLRCVISIKHHSQIYEVLL